MSGGRVGTCDHCYAINMHTRAHTHTHTHTRKLAMGSLYKRVTRRWAQCMALSPLRSRGPPSTMALLAGTSCRTAITRNLTVQCSTRRITSYLHGCSNMEYLINSLCLFYYKCITITCQGLSDKIIGHITVVCALQLPYQVSFEEDATSL